MSETILRTSRLELRPSSPEHLDGVWAAVEASLAELDRWMTWAVDPSRDSVGEFLTSAAESWSKGAERHFTLFYGGEVCGACSLDHLDPFGISAEMGYWLRSDLCGRGLMTEAAGEVLTYGFETMALHRIALHAGVDNVASCRVAEKLGFQKEGLLREASRGADGFYDCHAYGLLETDPRPPRAEDIESR